MRDLRQPTSASQRKMPSLRQPMMTARRALLVVVLLVAFDWLRSGDQQFSAQLYASAVRQYQAVGSPLLRRWVVCRYQPTCSEYSRQAVLKYGFPRGMALTVRRLASCQSDVAPGTSDPVP